MSAAGFSDEEAAAIDALAAWIVRRGLTTPAILFFEGLRPLNRVGSAAMTFLHPLVGAFAATPDYLRLRDALERREAIDLLLERIEARDAEGRGR